MKFLNCIECEKEFEATHWAKRYCCSDCQETGSKRKEWVKKKTNYWDRCRQLLSGAKNRSSTKNLPYDLDHDFLVELWESQNGKCAISGLTFNLDFPEKSGEPRFDAPSLDRIVPDLGYTKGNVRIVIYQINMAIGPYGLERLLNTIKAIQGQGIA